MLHIIHLLEREDRMQKLNKELYSQGIFSYQIHPGVRHKFSFEGIRRAHQNIVRKAQAESLPYITIAEDDIMFLGAGAYDYYISQMPEDLDSFDLYLGGIMNGEILEDNTVEDGYFTGLTLYTITQKFYDKFLSIRSVGNIDALLRGRGRYIVCNPMVVSQHGGYSDNKERIVESYNERLIGRNLYNNKNQLK